MQANDIIAVIAERMQAEAERFPAGLKTEVTAYFQDEEGNMSAVFDAGEKTFEAWGELTISTEPKENEEEGDSYTLPLMISIGKDGTVDDEEAESVFAELTSTVDEFLAGIAEDGAEKFLHDKSTEAERKYREELEKFNRSLRGMKRLVIGLSIAAAVLVILMVVISRVLG